MTETVTTTGTNTFTYAVADRRQILSGDVIGWQTLGTEIVNYKDSGSAAPYDDNYKMTTGSADSEGVVVTLTGQEINQQYAIYATLNDGNSPTFSNLPGIVSQSYTLFSTSSVCFTVIATDVDRGDVITFSLTGVLPSVHFTIDPATGEVTPTSSVAVNTYTLT